MTSRSHERILGLDMGSARSKATSRSHERILGAPRGSVSASSLDLVLNILKHTYVDTYLVLPCHAIFLVAFCLIIMLVTVRHKNST